MKQATLNKLFRLAGYLAVVGAVVTIVGMLISNETVVLIGFITLLALFAGGGVMLNIEKDKLRK